MLQWLMNSGGAGSREVCNSKIILNFNFRISECFRVLYCLFAAYGCSDANSRFPYVFSELVHSFLIAVELLLVIDS